MAGRARVNPRRFLTAFYQQFTSKTPQKHHNFCAIFRKKANKNATSPANKKIRLFDWRKLGCRK
jgi:hypothetical protein